MTVVKLYRVLEDDDAQTDQVVLEDDSHEAVILGPLWHHGQVRELAGIIDLDTDTVARLRTVLDGHEPPAHGEKADGYLWRPKDRNQWTFREKLDGRNYDAGSWFVAVRMIGQPTRTRPD